MRDNTLTLRLTEEERDLLREVARRLKRPFSQVVRELALARAMEELDELDLGGGAT